MKHTGNASAVVWGRAARAAAWAPAALCVLYALTRPLSLLHESAGTVMEAVVMRAAIAGAVILAAANHIFFLIGGFVLPARAGLGAALLWGLVSAGLGAAVVAARRTRGAGRARAWAAVCAVGSAGAWVAFWTLVLGAALADRYGFAAALGGMGAACAAWRMTFRNAPRPHPAAAPLAAALVVFAGLGLAAARGRTASDPESRVVFPGGAYDAARHSSGDLFVSGLAPRQLWRVAPGKRPRRIPLAGHGKPERLVRSGADLVLTRKTWNLHRGASLVLLNGRDMPSAARTGSQTSMIINAAADPRRARLFVINEFGRRVLELDARTLRTRRARVLPGARWQWPYGIAVSGKSGAVFVSRMFPGGDLVRIEDTGAVRARRFAPGLDLAADDARGLVFVARPLRARVDAVDMDTLRTRFVLPAGPGVRNLCVDPGAGLLAAGDFLMSRVYVYDLRARRRVRTLHPGPFPRGLHCGGGSPELLVSTARAVAAYNLADLHPANHGQSKSRTRN